MKKQLILVGCLLVFFFMIFGLQAQWNIENSTAIVKELKQGEDRQGIHIYDNVSRSSLLEKVVKVDESIEFTFE